ncbi:hypothetical protein EHI42_20705 [Rhizobium hidalgonense]|uniref:hypothetical protein n=1 Tax=Rhizobium hidalgonense TaxID=1538159 RepID=UPI000FEC560A|nr:hypothetical protein [Rhizobium hidalgonense]RWX13457.1 hypothetical protein EHI42_20705 [Rhizobium hidalgonense]
MDYTQTEYQRHKLDRGLKKILFAPSIPRCDDGKPCMDGRCPMCGSDLAASLEDFLNRAQGPERTWTQAAFVLHTQTSEMGNRGQFPLGPTRDAVQAISSTLQTRNSAFIGTFGLLVEKGKGGQKKAAAIEICYSGGGRDPVGTAVEILNGRFGAPATPLCGARRVPAGERSATLLADELLYGYQCHASKALESFEGIFKKRLLAELAENYGTHRIGDRLITHGLSVERGTISLSPGNFWPLPLDAIKNFKRRRWV